MVSMAQMHKVAELTAAGWRAVEIPFGAQTAFGGPALLVNDRGEVVRVHADGRAVSLAEPADGPSFPRTPWHAFAWNDAVAVRLTERGLRLYREHYARYGIERTPDTDAEGWWRFQFWQLMAVFGAHVYADCEKPFDGEIRLLGSA